MEIKAKKRMIGNSPSFRGAEMRWIENWRLGDENLIKSDGWNPRPEPPSVLVALRNGVYSVEEAIADKALKIKGRRKGKTWVSNVVGLLEWGLRLEVLLLYRRTSPNTFGCWLFVAGSLTLHPVCNSLTPTNPSLHTAVLPRGRGPCEGNSAFTYGPAAYSSGAYSWGSDEILRGKREVKWAKVKISDKLDFNEKLVLVLYDGIQFFF